MASVTLQWLGYKNIWTASRSFYRQKKLIKTLGALASFTCEGKRKSRLVRETQVLATDTDKGEKKEIAMATKVRAGQSARARNLGRDGWTGDGVVRPRSLVPREMSRGLIVEHTKLASVASTLWTADLTVVLPYPSGTSFEKRVSRFSSSKLGPLPGELEWHRKDIVYS